MQRAYHKWRHALLLGFFGLLFTPIALADIASSGATSSSADPGQLDRVQIIPSGETQAAPAPVNIELNFIKLDELNQSKGNQLLVKFKTMPAQNGLPAVMNPFTSRFPITKVKAFYQPKTRLNAWAESLRKWRVITFAEGVNVKSAFMSLRQHSAVERVAPNAKFTTDAIPNDLSDDLWGLNNTGQEREIIDYSERPYYQTGTPDADIDAPEAWNIRSSTDDIVVAVIDTGVDYNHPDLAANIWTNPGEIAGNGIDDDGNGYVDDVHGYDFGENDADPMDTLGHGTHVAGTIGAVGNNGIGVTGVAWQTKIMVLKASPDNANSLYTSDIVDAILYAADMGARVSNNSYGSFFSNSVAMDVIEQPMKEAISYANAAGHLFVASAGNDYSGLDGRYVHSPAGMQETNVMSVAATNDKDSIAYFSNYGRTEVHIAAPGDLIYSTLPNNSYGTYSGTSMSAPHITAAAALVFAEKPELTPAEVRALVVRTADPLSGNAGENMAGGRLNLFTLLDTAHQASGGSCASYSATLSAHKTAGRAYSQTTGQTCWFGFCFGGTTTYYAVGSDETLGTTSYSSVTLYENSPGYFSKTQNCQAGFDNYPVVKLNGLYEEYLVASSGVFIDEGATANDREDGDISANIQLTGTVDLSKAGQYVLKYQVADSSGNVSLPAYRIIHVTEIDENPEVYLFGPQCLLPLYCEAIKSKVGSTWSEPGYIAVDLIDRDLTEDVFYLDPNAIDTSYVHATNIYYEVIDSAGNHNLSLPYRYRVLFTLDENEPLVILFKNWDDLSPATDFYTWKRPEDSEETYSGFNWIVTDYNDDYIPYENIAVIGVEEVNLKAVGTYPISITATDTQGYSNSASANVHVVEDITPPVLILQGQTVFTVEIDSYVYIDWPTATDDLASWVSITRTITNSLGEEVDFDSKITGTYTFTYTASDEAGNAAIPVMQTVNVVRTGFDHPPRLTGYSSTSNPPKVAFTAYDIDDDLVAVQIRESGMTDWMNLTQIDDKWIYELPEGFFGEKMFDARAIDANNNISEDWYTVNLARWHNPVIESANMSLEGTRAVITATASDADNDLSYGEIRVDNGSRFRCTGGAYAFTCKSDELSNGQHTVELYAVDERGNRSTSQYFYPEIIPAQPPVITSANANVSGDTVTITGTASDPNNNITSVRLDTDTTSVTCSGTTSFTCQVTGVAPGNHVFPGVYAIDSTGLQSAVYGPFSITINTAPSCITSDNRTHINQGRATQCGLSFFPSACAKGSGTNLGYAATYYNQTSSVQQQSPNYWVKVNSCP